MINFVVGEACSARGHAADLRHYDRLAPELRDKLKVARTNLCAGCIAAMARREGLEQTIAYLDHERRFREVHCRRGQFLVREEEIRPCSAPIPPAADHSRPSARTPESAPPLPEGGCPTPTPDAG